VSRSTISTFKLFELFPDEQSARKYLESRLWPNGVACPECKSKERITIRKDGFYRCNACKLDFTVRTGTIFARQRVYTPSILASIAANHERGHGDVFQKDGNYIDNSRK
jgi:hypothetical protein